MYAGPLTQDPSHQHKYPAQYGTGVYQCYTVGVYGWLLGC